MFFSNEREKKQMNENNELKRKNSERRGSTHKTQKMIEMKKGMRNGMEEKEEQTTLLYYGGGERGHISRTHDYLPTSTFTFLVGNWLHF